MQGCKRVCFGFVLFSLICIVGCNGDPSPQAKEFLNSGTRAFQRGDFAVAIEDMDAFLKLHPKGRGTDEGYFTRGLSRYRLNDRPRAKSDLDEAIARTHLKHIKAHASNALGDIAWDEGDMALSERMYRAALKNLEQDVSPADHARYRLGCVLQRQSAWKQADLQFDRLIHCFEGSEIARLAERRVRARGWTIQMGAFRDGKRAEAVAERLTPELPTRVESVVARGELLFLVHVGRYSTYEEAVAELPAVKEHCKDAYVTVTR